MGDADVPAVSVVVPSYQNARFIRETIDSILAQTYDDFELLVSDHSLARRHVGDRAFLQRPQGSVLATARRRRRPRQLERR